MNDRSTKWLHIGLKSYQETLYTKKGLICFFATAECLTTCAATANYPRARHQTLKTKTLKKKKMRRSRICSKITSSNKICLHQSLSFVNEKQHQLYVSLY